MLTGGGYSDKFQELTSKDGKLSKQGDSMRAQQLAVRDRARKLSLETNRRRRALELKKRLEAQKEAKRREEVLEERRKRQQEATHKFQRLRKTSPRASDKTPVKPYSNTPLHDGIHIAHGFRVDGVNGSRGYQQDTPDLEDALRLVGGYSHSAYGSHTAPAGYITSALYQHEYSQSDPSLHRKYGMDNNSNVTSTHGNSYHGYSTSATVKSNTSSHGMPAKQFHKDLQEQQRKFVEEQAKSLQEFNEEIMKETTSTSVLERSDSLSSLDSLEEQPHNSRKETKDDTKYSVTKPSGPAVTVNYYTQGHFPSPTDTKIFQKPKQTPSNNATDPSNGKLFVSNQRTFNKEVVKDHQKQANNELQIEETSETDIVSEAVEERKPVLLQGSGYHPKSSLPRSYADAIGNQYNSRTSETWVPQASYESSYVNSGHSAGVSTAFSGTPNNGSGISGGLSSARTRNFPVKPSATTFAVVPNTNGSNISHQSRQAVSTPNNTHYAVSSTHEPVSTSPYRTKERLAVTNVKEQRGVQFDEAPIATDKPIRTGGNAKKLAKEPVRSILKKTSSDQPAKLGGFKVRDSLEITKQSPGRKKSVRWTDDVEYEYDKVEPDGQDTSATVGNGYEEPTSEESKDSVRTDAPSTQNRPMSSVAGRDSRVSSAQDKQKGSSKSKLSSYNNSSYASTYASKKQVENQPPAVLCTGADNPGSKAVSSRNVYKNGTSGNKSVTSTAVKNGAVHNANGLRLDKTPTDAEINWLWNKVRTCLNSKDEKEEEQPRVVDRPPSGHQSRQLASVTSQYIDGGRITANLRIMSPQANAAAQSRSSSVPRWRTSSDSGSYLRKTALLHQRRQHSAIQKGTKQGSGQQQPVATRLGSGQQQPVPSSSHQGPSRTVTMPPSNYDDEVSDSLLAFQKAEQLVNDNISENDIAAAIDNQRSTGNQDKVLSALSMEEQRLLESLDRLNDRLRSVAPEVSPYMAITPKPPPFAGGFRGKRPLSSKQQMVQGDQMPLSRMRASSADRSNVRINAYN